MECNTTGGMSSGTFVTLNNNLTGNVSGDVEIQPVFLQKIASAWA